MTDPRIGTVLDERYQILDQLGSGGMGVVYRGERLKLGRNVAIKFLHAWMASDTSFLKRFEIEARAMAKLQHPHCASVIDFGVDGQAPYVVMDLVTGEPLRALLDRERLAVPRALEIIRQVLSGLAHAHEQGITHRDIKPDNVMVDSSGAFGDQVRILDFGLAKLRENTTGLTTGFVVGTPSYMAPEQTMAEAVDERTDVYSAGVLLFEMLTGTTPFRADEVADVLRMHREAPPPRLAQADPGTIFSSELEAVVAQALAKTPAHRFPSAAAFASALDAVPEATRGTTGERPAISERPATGSDVRLVPEGGEQAVLSTAATAFLGESSPSMAAPSESGAMFAPAPSAGSGATASLRSESEHGPAVALPPATGSGATAALQPATDFGASATTSFQPPGPAAPALAPGLRPDPGTATPPGGAPADLAPVLPQSHAPRPGHRTRWVGAGLGILGIGVLLAIGLSGVGDPESTEDGVQLLGTATGSPLPPGRTGPSIEARDRDIQEPEAEPEIEAPVRAPVAPVAPPAAGGAEPSDLARARALIQAGRAQQARKILEKLKPRHRSNPEIHYLLGKLYFDMLWCADGVKAYRAAIAIHPDYRSDPVLIDSTISGLANDKHHALVARFIAQEIGEAAIPALEQMARSYPRQNVRERAARVLDRLR